VRRAELWDGNSQGVTSIWLHLRCVSRARLAGCSGSFWIIVCVDHSWRSEHLRKATHQYIDVPTAETIAGIATNVCRENCTGQGHPLW
jgi:hypothetical protein